MTQRAVVLGGGGITGVAWEWGMLAGLGARGVDLRQADVVIGTSAGSVVGAQLAAGLDVQERYRSQLGPPDRGIAAVLGTGWLVRYALAVLIGPQAPRRMRARVGRLASRARTASEAEWVGSIESRLPVRQWPDRPLRITAVDADTGEFRVFDRDCDVSLVRAVAASCAVPGVWPPVTIDGRRYVDGGVRSVANADLAAGCDRVVVLAPVPRGLGPVTTTGQVKALRAHARVVLVTPDRAALRAFGRNVLDPAKRADAARAGLAQAASVLDRVRAVWDD